MKNKLEEEFKENQKITANLVGSEQKLNGLRGRLSKIDPMDNKSIKLLYEEAVNIKNSLTPELNSVSLFTGLFLFYWNPFYFQARTQELEQSIRNSTVRINFEKSKTDEFLTSLRAENDTIFIKMASNLEVTQPSHVKYLSVRYLSFEFSE